MHACMHTHTLICMQTRAFQLCAIQVMARQVQAAASAGKAHDAQVQELRGQVTAASQAVQEARLQTERVCACWVQLGTARASGS